MAVIQELVDRIENTEDRVCVPLAGSYKTACECMLLPLHRHCVVSEHEPDWGKLGLQQLFEVFAKQILNDSSDTTEVDQVKTAATKVLKAASSLRAGKHLEDR